ncbi:MAG: signal transduction histidine kinase [Ignavibacteria bacterium]|nr:signal transduction histidine kinase [Ignavibacteria bacterium]
MNMKKINDDTYDLNNVDKRLIQIAKVCGTLISIIGAMVLAGYGFGEIYIFSLGKNFIPMADETALLFLLLGITISVQNWKNNPKFKGYFVPGSAFFIIIFSLLSVIDVFTNSSLKLGNLFGQHEKFLGSIQVGHISFITAFCFIIIGIALLLLRKNKSNLSAYFSFFILFSGFVIIYGYLYGSPILYGGTMIPVAFPTAIALLISAIALLVSAGKGVFPLKYFMGETTQARLMRNLLPVIFIFEIAQAWASRLFSSGYSSIYALRDSVVAILELFIIGFIITLLSRSIGKSIDKNIAERKRVEEEMRESRDQLSVKTDELIKTYDELEESRIAALNMMEDAIEAKNNLIASETRYRRLFEAAKDGILILDAETGMIIDVNPFLIELLGYSKEEFIEKEIWEIGFFKDIVENHDKFLELQQMEFVRYEDLPLETAKGRQINVEFVSNVYLVNHKKVIQCIIRDITERKKAEKELLETKEKYQAIFESTGTVTLIVEEDTTILMANNECYSITGFTPDELIGQKWIQYVAPES